MAGCLGSSPQTTRLSASFCYLPAPRSRLSGAEGPLPGEAGHTASRPVMAMAGAPRGSRAAPPPAAEPRPGPARRGEGPRLRSPALLAAHRTLVTRLLAAGFLGLSPGFGSVPSGPLQYSGAALGRGRQRRRRHRHRAGSEHPRPGAEGCTGGGGTKEPPSRGSLDATCGAAPSARPPQHHPGTLSATSTAAPPARRLMNGRGGSPAPPDVTPANGGAGCAAG